MLQCALRPIEEADLDQIFELMRDPESVRMAAFTAEDPSDRRYNRPFRRSANEPGDRLWRDDGLYDIFIEIDHNIRPRVAGRGSAVFVHVARPGFAPTAGCIALRRGDLLLLLRRITPKTRIIIHN